MSTSDNFYFENVSDCAMLSKKAASFLVECLENYSSDNIEKCLMKCTVLNIVLI